MTDDRNVPRDNHPDDRTAARPMGEPATSGQPADPAYTQQPTYEQPAQSRGSNGIAIAALVCGLLSIPLLILAGLGALVAVVGLILGFVGVSKANKMGGTGKGMAITGIVSSLLCLLLVAAVFFFGLQFIDSPMFQQQLQEAQQEVEEQGG